MHPPLFGLETELAICGRSSDGSELGAPFLAREFVRAACDEIEHLPGDGRIWTGSGASFMVDQGFHPEWCTPECRDPADLVAHMVAGQRVVARLRDRLISQLDAAIKVYKSAVDYAGQTWGSCHSSYCGRQRSVRAYVPWLTAHLASRHALCGAGGLDPSSAGVRLSTSPRAAYIETAASANTTADRGVFNLREEPLAAGEFCRIHVVSGDLAGEWATWWKVGSTALIVAMADDAAAGGPDPDWPLLVKPAEAMRNWARDLTWRAGVRAAGRRGVRMTAIEVQRLLVGHVSRWLLTQQSAPDWAPAVVDSWTEQLERLEAGGDQADGPADWQRKFALFRREIARSGFDPAPEALAAWNATVEDLAARMRQLSGDGSPPSLAGVEVLRKHGLLTRGSLDILTRPLQERGLAFDRLDEFMSLRARLMAFDLQISELDGLLDRIEREGVGGRVVSEERIALAERQPPPGTRAVVRGHWVKKLQGEGRENYRASWTFIAGFDKQISMGNPFNDDPAIAWEEAFHPLDARCRAHDLFVSGDYAGAERLLVRCLEADWERASTRTHLARICLATGRMQEAAVHTRAAFEERAACATYVVGRTLWLQLALELIAGITMEEGTSARQVLGQLKHLLNHHAVAHTWTMEPVLAHLQPRIGASGHALLTVLWEALGEGLTEARTDALGAFDVWRMQEPLPLE